VRITVRNAGAFESVPENVADRSSRSPQPPLNSASSKQPVGIQGEACRREEGVIGAEEVLGMELINPRRDDLLEIATDWEEDCRYRLSPFRLYVPCVLEESSTGNIQVFQFEGSHCRITRARQHH